MPVTRRQTLKIGPGLLIVSCGPLSFLQAAAQTNAAPVPDTQVSVSAQDVAVSTDDRTIRIPVRLSLPAIHTIVVQYSAQGADGADDMTLTPADGQLIFQPGEQTRLIELTLSRPLARGQSIALKISDFGYPLRHYPRPASRVTAADQPGPPASRSDSVPLPLLPENGKVVFSDDLRRPDFASDSGFRADGAPCWQSRLARTRQQRANEELGYYADPVLNPEVKVWGIDLANGNRFIQAEHVPNGLSDGHGGKIMLSWRPDTPVSYSAAIVTTRTLFNRITIGSYIEFEVKLSKVPGIWPGLWLLTADDIWPPEIDVLEVLLVSPKHAPDVISSSIHWRGAKGHEMYGAAVPLAHVEPAADIFARYNRFGCFIGETQITYYFNDKPYCAMPNLGGAGPWYMLLQVAVGGKIIGTPMDPTAFPAPLYIAGVKVIQFS